MKRTNDFLVGLTVLVGAAIIVVASVWATGRRPGDDQRQLIVRVREVGNTRVGNAVVIRGVQAGRIDGIELAAGGWVYLRLAMQEEVDLPRDPVVILNQTSLFGDWQATVTDRSGAPDDPDVRRQLAEASGAPGVLPGATLPDIGQLTAVAGRIAGDVADVAGRVEVAFDDSAARELRLAIHNTAQLSSELARVVRVQSRNIDTLSSDVRRGARALQRAAARIDSATSQAELQQIVTDVSLAAVRLREASEEFRALSRRLGPAEHSLTTVLARTDTISARIASGQGTLGLMLNDPSLYHNGDSLLVDLRALVRDIKQNPRRYVNVRVF